VRSGVSNIDEETRGQLALNIQIPLLHGPFFWTVYPVAEKFCSARANVEGTTFRPGGTTSVGPNGPGVVHVRTPADNVQLLSWSVAAGVKPRSLLPWKGVTALLTGSM